MLGAVYIAYIISTALKCAVVHTMANIYKYYNNGFLRISGIYGATCFTHDIEGYYYNTQVIGIHAFFDSKDATQNNITINIDDGGFHSSPYTTKMLKRMVGDILYDIDCDMGSEWENNAYNELRKAISGAFSLYFNKFRKCECKSLANLSGSNQRIYFNF